MLLTTGEVAEVLRIHETTVRRLVDRGKIEAIRVDKRNLRFNAEKVAEFAGLSNDDVISIIEKKETYSSIVDCTWINSSVWKDERFQALDDDGKWTFMFMMTFAVGQETGVFELYGEEIRENLWWIDWDKLLMGIYDMQAKGFVEFDKHNHTAVFPEISKYRSVSKPDCPEDEMIDYNDEVQP